MKITVSNQRPSDSATLQLAEESHEPIISKFEKPKVHSSYKDNIRGADLDDKEFIRKFIDGIPFLLCLIDIYGKYASIVPLKDKEGIRYCNY